MPTTRNRDQELDRFFVAMPPSFAARFVASICTPRSSNLRPASPVPRCSPAEGSTDVEQAVQRIEAYRFDHGVTDPGEALGPSPPDARERLH